MAGGGTFGRELLTRIKPGLRPWRHGATAPSGAVPAKVDWPMTVQHNGSFPLVFVQLVAPPFGSRAREIDRGFRRVSRSAEAAMLAARV